MCPVLSRNGDVNTVSAASLRETDQQRCQRVAAGPARRGLRCAGLSKTELPCGISHLKEADPVHTRFISELQLVRAFDLAHSGVECMSVQRVVQDRERL